MKQARRLGAVLLVVAMPEASAGMTSSAAAIAEAAVKSIEYELPDPAALLGVEPHGGAVVMVIADFNEGATDCRAIGLGRALGATLRVESWGLSKALAFSHPTGYWADRRNRDNDHQTPGERAARRVGADLILQGSVSEDARGLALQLKIVRVASAEPAAFEASAPFPEVGALLAEVIETTLRTVHAEPDPAAKPRLAALRRTGADELLALTEVLEHDCADQPYAPELERAWQRHGDFPTIAALFAGEVTWLKKGDEALRTFATIRDRAPGHPVVDLTTSYHTLRTSRRNQNGGALAALKGVAARYAHEPAAIHALADALSSEELLCDRPEGDDGPIYIISGAIPHSIGHAASIALALRAVETWPNDYRAWWSVGYALVQYARLIRGFGYWSEVPEAARRRYPGIMEAADRALAEAISRHPLQSGLYRLQIQTDVAMHRAWVPSFELGIRAGPHDASVYRTAFDYALDPWGGNVLLRWRIYGLARANNPAATWPDAMYRNQGPEWEAFVVTRPYQFFALLALAAVTVLAWRWRLKSSEPR